MLNDKVFVPCTREDHDSSKYDEWLRNLPPTYDMASRMDLYLKLTDDLQTDPERDNDYLTRVIARRIGIACGIHPPFWPRNPAE